MHLCINWTYVRYPERAGERASVFVHVLARSLMRGTRTAQQAMISQAEDRPRLSSQINQFMASLKSLKGNRKAFCASVMDEDTTTLAQLRHCLEYGE